MQRQFKRERRNGARVGKAFTETGIQVQVFSWKPRSFSSVGQVTFREVVFESASNSRRIRMNPRQEGEHRLVRRQHMNKPRLILWFGFTIHSSHRESVCDEPACHWNIEALTFGHTRRFLCPFQCAHPSRCCRRSEDSSLACSCLPKPQLQNRLKLNWRFRLTPCGT